MWVCCCSVAGLAWLSEAAFRCLLPICCPALTPRRGREAPFRIVSRLLSRADDPFRLREPPTNPPRQRREGERDRSAEHRPAGADQREQVVGVCRLRPDLLVERVDDRRGGKREDDDAPAGLPPFEM